MYVCKTCDNTGFLSSLVGRRIRIIPFLRKKGGIGKFIFFRNSEIRFSLHAISFISSYDFRISLVFRNLKRSSTSER